MTKKQSSKSKQSKAEEPQTAYATDGARFFNSLTEMDEDTARQRARLSHDKRLEYAEQLRKRVFNRFLLADCNWACF